MQVIEKFVIDRNNLRYIYTEKLIGNFHNVSYHIYTNADDYVSLTSDEFYSIYGEDYKASIKEFVKYSMGDILCSKDNISDTPLLIRDLRLLEKHFNKYNTNPSLWGYRDTLLKSIDKYNYVVENRAMLEDEYNYADDLKKLDDDNLDLILERVREEDIL